MYSSRGLKKSLCYYFSCSCLDKNLSENSSVSPLGYLGWSGGISTSGTTLLGVKLRVCWQLLLLSPWNTLGSVYLRGDFLKISASASVPIGRQKGLWGPWQAGPSHGVKVSSVKAELPVLGPVPEGVYHLEETTQSSDSPEQLFWKYFPLGWDMGRWIRQEQMSLDLERGYDLEGHHCGVVTCGLALRLSSVEVWTPPHTCSVTLDKSFHPSGPV